MRKRKNNIVPIFVGLIILLGIGYAYLNSGLSINGTTNISNANWNVYWDSLNVTEGSVEDVTTAAHILIGETEVEFNVNFTKPGDFYEFTVDAVNDGSIDAMIDSLTKGVYASNGTTPKTLPDYLTYSVTYSDGVEIESNHLLSAGNTETYKVRVEYKTDIEANQLPSTADNYMFKIAVNYKQADNTATNKPSSYVYTVNHYYNDESVYLNRAFPTSITKYQTPSEALTAIATASSLDLPFYLKHKIENGIVTESYVEFVVTPEMAAANSGMMAGTYTLRGEKTYDLDTSTWLVGTDYISPYYEANKEAIKTAFGYATNPSRCSESGTGRSSHLFCGISSLDAGAGASGSVSFTSSDNNCGVSADGSSSCVWY